jgi:hypothetical protein
MHAGPWLPSVIIDVGHSVDEPDTGIMSARLSAIVEKTDIQKIHVFLYKMAGYCAQQSILHDNSRITFKWYNYGLSIPAILLSTISGSVNTMSAVSAESGDCKDKLYWLNILCGVAGLIAAAILSIHRFANYAELEHQHAVYADSFEQRNLAIRTNILLDASGQNKTFTNLYEYLKHCRDDVSLLVEKSPSVPSRVRNKYKTKKKIIKL